jgi:hypothetical protein
MAEEIIDMNSSQRLMSVWDRKIPDRTPWSPMLGDSYLRSFPQYWDQLTADQKETLKTSYRYPSLIPVPKELGFAEEIIQQMTMDVGGDYLTSVSTLDIIDSKVEIEIFPGQEEQTKYTFRTPWGNLQEIVSGSGSAETVYRLQFAIKDRDDYQIMTRIMEERSFRSNYGLYEETLSKLGGKGASTITGLDQPLVALFRVRDPQELIFDLVDEPERMKAFLDLIHQKTLEGYLQIAKGPGRVVETGMAFMTTRLISPWMFERYVLPYLSQYVDVLQKSGKIVISHMCGHIKKLLPMLREAGIDGIDSLSNPPIGDTELETFWDVMGDAAILQAGLDVNILHQASPQQVRDHVRDVLKRTEGRHLILRSADEVPFGTPVENLLAVAQEIQ